MEMDYISLIKRPITDELDDFNKLFDEALSHTDGMLAQALDHIRRRTGKRMRPILILLMTRNHGMVNSATQNAAVDWSYCTRQALFTMMWWMRVRSVADRLR